MARAAEECIGDPGGVSACPLPSPAILGGGAYTELWGLSPGLSLCERVEVEIDVFGVSILGPAKLIWECPDIDETELAGTASD